MPAPWTRRSVLALIGVGAGLALTGCSADDGTGQPQRRTGPEPSPAPPSEVADVPALLAALHRSRELSAATPAVAGADATLAAVLEQARAAHATQVEVLERLLVAGAVPVPPAPAATSGAGASAGRADDTSATTSAAPGEQADGRAAERARQQARDLGLEVAQDVAPAALNALAEVSGANLAMLTAVAGQRGALATLLGSGPTWEPLRGPTGAAATGVLAALRPAVYSFEVIAARATGVERERFETTLEGLRQLTRALTALAAAAAPPAPLGYGLPHLLDTPDRRRRLATAALVALPPAVVGQAGAHTGDPGSVTGTVRLLSELLVLGRPWGLELSGFPGMSVP